MTTGGVRTPMEHMVVLYGGPARPWIEEETPWQPPLLPQPFVPLVPPSTPAIEKTTTGSRIEWPEAKSNDDDYTRVKAHVRVVTRKEADGTIKLKVYVDGKLQTEVESDGSTICAEIDV